MMYEQPVGEHQNTKCHIHNAEEHGDPCFKVHGETYGHHRLIENRIRHLFVRVAVGECDEMLRVFSGTETISQLRPVVCRILSGLRLRV